MHPIQKKYLSYQEFSIRFKCMRVSWKYEKFYDFLNRENILSFKYVVATKYYVHLKAFKRENFETIQTRKTGYFSWDRQIFSLMKPKWDNLPLISFVQMHLSTDNQFPFLGLIEEIIYENIEYSIYYLLDPFLDPIFGILAYSISKTSCIFKAISQISSPFLLYVVQLI